MFKMIIVYLFLVIMKSLFKNPFRIRYKIEQYDSCYMDWSGRYIRQPIYSIYEKHFWWGEWHYIEGDIRSLELAKQKIIFYKTKAKSKPVNVVHEE